MTMHQTITDGAPEVDAPAAIAAKHSAAVDRRRRELAACALRLLLADTVIDRALMQEPDLQERLISLRDAITERLGQ